MKCVKIIVSGLVQGVGYRYFCVVKSKEYNIKGYAKNLYDGDVELEIEGRDSMVNDFIKELKMGPIQSQVKALNIEEKDYANKYKDFTVY